mmetsp:Transcript_3153/g.4849  ORF Transcript_3153/g.4849 Transcript_3153/m.4849 type:complete len:604 (+) Transcript_3153:8-1819(+)
MRDEEVEKTMEELEFEALEKWLVARCFTEEQITDVTDNTRPCSLSGLRATMEQQKLIDITIEEPRNWNDFARRRFVRLVEEELQGKKHLWSAKEFKDNGTSAEIDNQHLDEDEDDEGEESEDGAAFEYKQQSSSSSSSSSSHLPLEAHRNSRIFDDDDDDDDDDEEQQSPTATELIQQSKNEKQAIHFITASPSQKKQQSSPNSCDEIRFHKVAVEEATSLNKDGIQALAEFHESDEATQSELLLEQGHQYGNLAPEERVPKRVMNGALEEIVSSPNNSNAESINGSIIYDRVKQQRRPDQKIKKDSQIDSDEEKSHDYCPLSKKRKKSHPPKSIYTINPASGKQIPIRILSRSFTNASGSKFRACKICGNWRPLHQECDHADADIQGLSPEDIPFKQCKVCQKPFFSMLSNICPPCVNKCKSDNNREACARYKKYKSATTVSKARESGALSTDLSHDIIKGWAILSNHHQEGANQGDTNMEDDLQQFQERDDDHMSTNDDDDNNNSYDQNVIPEWNHQNMDDDDDGDINNNIDQDTLDHIDKNSSKSIQYSSIPKLADINNNYQDANYAVSVPHDDASSVISEEIEDNNSSVISESSSLVLI